MGAIHIQQKIPSSGSKISWGRIDRDGDRSRFIPLSKKKMVDVVLLVSEL